MTHRPLSYLLPACLAAGVALPAREPAPSWTLPTEVRTLPNGLTVVVSEDHGSPLVGVSVVYRVGFRLEPKGRTGFAHLFEHLMFEGTPKAPKGVFDRVIQGGGGLNNGSTRYDFTNYIESAPASALEPILWLEADRMAALDFSEKNLQNQREVVKEEIRVNVKNQPYGGFYWLDITGLAFDRWENRHDGYGSFEDLDRATVEDAKAFHATYYTPANAVLAVAGDVKAAEVFGLAEKYFAGIPSRPRPALPDLREGLGKAERRIEQKDPLAKAPALAVGWRMPERGSKDHAACAVLAELLAGGEASRLYQGLVKGKELLLNINGGINWPLASAWDYDGPTLLTLFAVYKPNADADKVLAALDAEIQAVAKAGVPQKELDRTRTKMLSDYYGGLEGILDRADALARAQALWGRASQVNEFPAMLQAVTPADLRRVAAAYLVRDNRVVIDRKPAPAEKGGN